MAEKKETGKKGTNKPRKRIQGVIREEKIHDVLRALGKAGIPATFYDSKGIGTGEKYQIRYGRRGDLSTMAYSNRRTVETIADEDKVEAVVKIIKDNAKISKSGGAGGIIIISPIEEFITI